MSKNYIWFFIIIASISAFGGDINDNTADNFHLFTVKPTEIIESFVEDIFLPDEDTTAWISPASPQKKHQKALIDYKPAKIIFSKDIELSGLCLLSDPMNPKDSLGLNFSDKKLPEMMHDFVNFIPTFEPEAKAQNRFLVALANFLHEKMDVVMDLTVKDADEPYVCRHFTMAFMALFLNTKLSRTWKADIQLVVGYPVNKALIAQDDGHAWNLVTFYVKDVKHFWLVDAYNRALIKIEDGVKVGDLFLYLFNDTGNITRRKLLGSEGFLGMTKLTCNKFGIGDRQVHNGLYIDENSGKLEVVAQQFRKRNHLEAIGKFKITKVTREVKPRLSLGDITNTQAANL